MRFLRSRIPARVLRALLPINISAYQQCLLKRDLGSLQTKGRMTLSVSPLHWPARVVEKSNGSDDISLKTAKVVFVLGGPGSGKGTQCALIVEHFGFTHLSAGDLLRAEINSGNENGVMIQSMIKEGKIVPSEVTVRLLLKAMLKGSNNKFLIDGFPRNDENRAAFELVTGIQPEFILFFNCTEEEMEKRALGRNQGRVDDNIETIRKRFKVFVDSSLPVISHYESVGKVRKINADQTRDEVFESVRPLFAPFLKEVA